MVNLFNNKILYNIFIILSIILLVSGITLYFGEYFWGLLLILLSIILYSIPNFFSDKKENFKELIIQKIKVIIYPIIGIGASLIIGGIIMIISGYNPIEAYAALFYGGFYKNWGTAIINATPLIFTGLAIAFAFQANLFNIGAEGQYYIGAMVATYLGLYIKLPSLFSLLIIFIVGAIIAGLYNIIPAWLKVKTGASEVITTMMFAHIARYFSPIFIRKFGGDPAAKSLHPYVTDKILETNRLPRMKDFLPDADYRIHTGILIAVFLAVVVYYILFYTKLGYNIRAVGKNINASKMQGLNTGKIIFIALIISGMLAGFSGVSQITGLEHKLAQELNAGYGWNGISVALLASNDPIAVIFTALLWGGLDAGGQYIQRNLGISGAIVEIIKGIILFLVVARYIYNYFYNKYFKKPEFVSAEERV
ncbi:MAG: ABC transporter permease [Exilispira sp.]